MAPATCPRCGLDYERVAPGDHNGIHAQPLTASGVAESMAYGGHALTLLPSGELTAWPWQPYEQAPLTDAEAEAYRAYMIDLDKQSAEILDEPYEPPDEDDEPDWSDHIAAVPENWR